MKFALWFVIAAGSAAAQPNWASVKGLPIGGDIRVFMEGGTSYRGQVQSVTDESLIVVAANSQQSLARAQVRKVAIKGDSHRRRNTLIGLGVGAGAGLGVGAGIDHGCVPNGCFFSDNIGKAVFTPLGALIGTVIGVAWPTGGWHDIYRSK